VDAEARRHFKLHPLDAAHNARDGRWREKRLWEMGDIVDVLEAWEAI
jgi:hypothetical protein